MAEGKVGSEGPKQGREGVLHVINPRLEHALLPFVGFFPLFVSQLTPEFFTCCCRGAICSCSLMLAASPCFNRGRSRAFTGLWLRFPRRAPARLLWLCERVG